MRHEGFARLDKRTKDLVRRLGRNDIAIIDHVDIDRVSAEALLETGVEVVVNAAASISGAYPNVGPLLLTRAGVVLVDGVGPEAFDLVKEGERIAVEGDFLLKGDRQVARGTRLTVELVEQAMDVARTGLGEQLDLFARNTLEFLEREKDLLTEGTGVPATQIDMHGRHVLVVVRGYEYKEDLRALLPYIREMKPVILGVDGGADAVMQHGLRPDIIVGDMDSVSENALTSGAELIVHAYADGYCPGKARLDQLGLDAIVWPVGATSEDIGLLLAYESGADLIVAVGMHANLIEQLDKKRRGMASTFLVRLKVGPRLVDAKGVNKLYRTSAGPFHLVGLVSAALVAVSATVMISSSAREMVELLLLRVRTWVGL